LATYFIFLQLNPQKIGLRCNGVSQGLQNSTTRKFIMRIIAKRTLKEFWQKYPDSEVHLTEWYNIASKATWQNPGEVKEYFPSADYIGNNRMVF